MIVNLIRRFVWGNEEQVDTDIIKEIDDIQLDDEFINSTYEKSTTSEDEKSTTSEDEKSTTNEDEKSTTSEDEKSTTSEDEQFITSEDEIIQYNHSSFYIIFISELMNTPLFKTLFNLYIGLILFSISSATYNWFASDVVYSDIINTPNLPFCEKPFAMTPYMAQGASAIAHLPYVPALFLGISYVSPEMCDSLNVGSCKYAYDNRLFLWIQFALQLFTSISGHMIPNPRIALSQEISIALAFILLYNVFNLTTPHQSRQMIDAQSVSIVIAISVSGFLTVGLLPIIFVSFAVTLLLELVIPNSFGLLTPNARLMLLYPFAICAITLLVETMGCNWLMNHISAECPWHVVFDILFWQVLGSALDVVILSPRPGRFIMDD